MPKISHFVNDVSFTFELCSPEIYETFIYKHTETIEYVKK